MQKLERLLNLTAVLLHSGRPLSAAELRERVPGYADSDTAFRRAFERDKDDLREMGIPLELEEVPGVDPPVEGYRIPRDQYYLPDPGLDPEELLALQLAASAVQVEGMDEVEALWKLGGSSQRVSSPATAALPGDPNVAPLFEAVSARATARFRYHNEDREVHPYRLGFQRGNWYLRAFDISRNDVRVFRVDRISGTVELGSPKAFVIPDEESGNPDLVTDGWRLDIEPPVECRIRVDASHVPVALSHFDQDALVEREGDGSAIFRITVTNRYALRGVVLSYLEHAEILDPPELRADLIAWLRQIPGVES